jgi:hypothetical protein
MMGADHLSDIKSLLSSITSPAIDIGHMDESTAERLCLYRYAGRPPEEYTKRPGLQVMARSTNELTAAGYLRSVEALIDNKVNITITGTCYLKIRKLGESFPMGWENGKVRLAQNYMIERE